MKKKYLIVFLLLLPTGFYFGQYDSLKNNLVRNFKGDAKIEIGGYYAGIEMHHSSPIPQRISFYYPSANSIDMSTDYWKRDTSFIMQCGLKIDNYSREKIGFEPWEFNLTPYSAEFIKADKNKTIEISYHFSKNKPAVFMFYELKNNTNKTASFEFDVKIDHTLKTSHTYKTILPHLTENDRNAGTLYYHFNSETRNAVLFIANAGADPAQYDTSSSFVYKANLTPNAKMTVILIIGTCSQQEKGELTDYLKKNYQKEIDEFENDVLSKAYNRNFFITGDKMLDHSALWAKALLETSRHYIDGQIMPMPCPAEYNFFFTHDVLLTDLAAVNYDPERVKNDIRFIISHASPEKNIPHAYYWKDDKFVTEFADDANWNHFWFVIAAASYLRHSNDTAFANEFYPFVSKSIGETMKNKKEDGLMWAYRPDWWDIGRNWGPRSFMTILAAKALKDYIFISAKLNTNLNLLSDYEDTAAQLQKNLNDRLWDEQHKYFMNYLEDGSKDSHYYIGSLLAPHFNLTTEERKNSLVESAKNNLLDNKIGIYTAYPMDFHKLSDLWKFNGDEAGAEYFYINGGIWPHGNSWYSLALMAAGRKMEAFNFIKNCMTVDGVIESPNGQPAMYEYRNGKKCDPQVYGQIDKPQFMWAAGWYMYSLYHLFGIEENNWNIKLNPFNNNAAKDYCFNLNLNGYSSLINVTGKGEILEKIIFDGVEYPSLVIPSMNRVIKNIKIQLGKIGRPYLASINAELISCAYKKDSDNVRISSRAFPGYVGQARVISPSLPRKILVDAMELKNNFSVKKENGYFIIVIDYKFADTFAELNIEF